MHKIFWKVLNWNIRGLNYPDKWTLIFNKIRETGYQVIRFQESKIENVDISFLRQFCSRNFGSFAFVPSVGRSRGIITIWDSSIFTGHTIFHNQYALSVELHATRSDISWTLTSIYAPCKNNEQLEFLQWLHDVHIPADGSCLLVGDFNLLRSPQDRNIPGGNLNEMLLFNETISHLGLVEIPLRYTWSNMQNFPCYKYWIGSSLPWHVLQISQIL
jgi:exonuclease III